MTTTTDPIVTVRDLRISTGQRELVHGLDFEIRPGERVGLIGESGSGKSLTSSAIFGLLPDGLTASGSIRVAGISADVATATDRQVRGARGAVMSMVFQEPMTALNPTMKIGAQVREMIALHNPGMSKDAIAAKALALLTEVRMPDPAAALTAYPHELSGGQRQRVVIAMAIANNPALIIADEATTALDVTVQAQVLDLLDEAVERHESALLFITHDLAVVARMCDRVLVMLDGDIVESGPVAEVLTRPQHAYTQRLVAASDLTNVREDGRLGEGTMIAGGAQREHAEGPAVRFDAVTRVYGHGPSLLRPKARRVEALKQVSLEVGRGERFGIVGESGSGKSTLIRMIAGLDDPTEGTVDVLGKRVSGRSERQLRFLRDEVQFVFQDPMASLDPRMTVAQVIAEPLRHLNAAERAARVLELLEAVGLPADAADRFPHQFSGGQRQRISIARAIAPNPSILIADEPVSALDVSVRAQVLDLLNHLVDQYGLTLVFVSHDLAVVRHLCDRVAVIRHGDLIEVDDVEHIYSEQAKPYTKQLIAASSTLGEVLAERGLAATV